MNEARSEMFRSTILAVDCARGEAEAEGDEQFVRHIEENIFPFLEHQLQEVQGKEW